MSKNSATPPLPAPGPFCALVDAQLSLLALGELESEAAASANEHLADCAWCQQRLREYETVHAALHRTYAPPLPDATPAIPWAEIERMEAEVDQSVGGGEVFDRSMGRRLAQTRLAPSARTRRIAASLGTLAAAILIIVLLGSLLGWQRGIGGKPPQPTPTLDPQTRAYVTVLHTYYQPLFVAAAQDTVCEAAYSGAAASTKESALQSCRATSASVVSTAQTLADQLQTAYPPARWQTAHDDLKAAAQATINIFTARVAAIDAHNTSQFDEMIPQTHAVLGQYCGPIALINAGLPASEGLNPPNLSGCPSG